MNASVPVKVTHTHHLELGENAFWLSIWTMIAIALITLTFILAKRSLASDELIAKSSDPVALACATGYNTSVSNQCMAFLARKN
jgi:hypothetical protein